MFNVFMVGTELRYQKMRGSKPKLNIDRNSLFHFFVQCKVQYLWLSCFNVTVKLHPICHIVDR